MKKALIFALVLIASILPPSLASANDSCKQLNVPAQADDLLTVTMKSIGVVEKTGSFQLTITYEQKNNTSDKKIDEGQFKLFFTDGTSTPQYGFFGSFFPGDLRERSYTWEYLKSVTPMVISYNAGFFATEPSSSKLNWAPPGQACVLVSPTVRAKQEAEAKAKQEAETKAAADRAAAAIEAASKAIDAANKATEAANKAAAEAEAKADIEAARQAAIAEAARQVAIAEASNKATVETVRKKITITCVKGKTIKKVTAIKPKCPKGFKKK
jgi:hypothetical protein